MFSLAKIFPVYYDASKLRSYICVESKFKEEIFIYILVYIFSLDYEFYAVFIL